MIPRESKRKEFFLDDQNAINAEEYADPKNWHYVLYASRRDSLIVVPKKNRRFGYTVNFAKPLGIMIHIINILVGTAIVFFIYLRFFAR